MFIRGQIYLFTNCKEIPREKICKRKKSQLLGSGMAGLSFNQ